MHSGGGTAHGSVGRWGAAHLGTAGQGERPPCERQRNFSPGLAGVEGCNACIHYPVTGLQPCEGQKGRGGLLAAAQVPPLGPVGVSRPCRQGRSRMAAHSQLPKLIPFTMPHAKVIPLSLRHQRQQAEAAGPAASLEPAPFEPGKHSTAVWVSRL